MTYGQWNTDQNDSRDEQQDGMGYGAQPEQADLGAQRQDVAGDGMQADDGGFGEERRQDVTGSGAQASQDPYGTEQPENRADYGEQAAPAGYGDEPRTGDAASQWR